MRINNIENEFQKLKEKAKIEGGVYDYMEGRIRGIEEAEELINGLMSGENTPYRRK